MNLLNKLRDGLDDEPTTFTGHLKKLAHQVGFVIFGTCSAVVVLGIVLLMRFGGRELRV